MLLEVQRVKALLQSVGGIQAGLANITLSSDRRRQLCRALTRCLLPSNINCGIILARVVEGTWLGLLIMPRRSRQATLMAVQGATGDDLVPTNAAGWLISGAR